MSDDPKTELQPEAPLPGQTQLGEDTEPDGEKVEEPAKEEDEDDGEEDKDEEGAEAEEAGEGNTAAAVDVNVDTA